MTDLIALAKRYYRAYETGDRAFVEDNLAAGFTFTSPYDDAIGREAYFARCWPNHTAIAKFHFVAVAQDGDGVAVVYRCETRDGGNFGNTEYLQFEAGKLKSVAVYFGDPPKGLTRTQFAAQSGAA